MSLSPFCLASFYAGMPIGGRNSCKVSTYMVVHVASHHAALKSQVAGMHGFRIRCGRHKTSAVHTLTTAGFAPLAGSTSCDHAIASQPSETRCGKTKFFPTKQASHAACVCISYLLQRPLERPMPWSHSSNVPCLKRLFIIV